MAENRRRITSVRQLELLIEYMEKHKALALGRVRGKEARAPTMRLWEQCALILNKDKEGDARTGKEWSKVWVDYKCRVRSKLNAIRRGDGSSAALELSSLEHRVISLIGRDVGPLTGVGREPVVHSHPNDEENIVIEVENIERKVSPTLLLKINGSVGNNGHVSPPYSPDRTMSSDTPDIPKIEGRDNDPLSLTNPLPSPGNTSRSRYRERLQRTKRTRARPRFVHQCNTAALEEICESIARIEEMHTIGDARQAEAAVTQAEALRSLADSARIIALSFQGYINHLCRNN